MVDGNRLQIVAAFRERDAVQCVRRVASTLREHGLTNFVSADAGGIGGPMCAQLSSDFGIYATRVNNGSPAHKKDDSRMRMRKSGSLFAVSWKSVR